MASSLTKWLVDPKKNWFAAQHMKSVSSRLRKYGPLSLSLPVYTYLCICVHNGSLEIQSQAPNFSFQFMCLSVHLCICEGLRHDDLYDPYYDLDVKEALNRLPREIVDARNQRLKRAMDLSMKHEYLPNDLQVSLSLSACVWILRKCRNVWGENFRSYVLC